MFLLILLLEVIAALGLGMMISAAAATPELALAVGIPITIISFVFAGFYSKCLCQHVVPICFYPAIYFTASLHLNLSLSVSCSQRGIFAPGGKPASLYFFYALDISGELMIQYMSRVPIAAFLVW